MPVVAPGEPILIRFGRGIAYREFGRFDTVRVPLYYEQRDEPQARRGDEQLVRWNGERAARRRDDVLGLAPVRDPRDAFGLRAPPHLRAARRVERNVLWKSGTISNRILLQRSWIAIVRGRYREAIDIVEPPSRNSAIVSFAPRP